MGLQGDIDAHFWLTRAVARLAGADLRAAMLSGQLTPDGYLAMVARCRANGCAERCALWLGAQTGRADPPDFCCHQADLRRLRRD